MDAAPISTVISTAAAQPATGAQPDVVTAQGQPLNGTPQPAFAKAVEDAIASGNGNQTSSSRASLPRGASAHTAHNSAVDPKSLPFAILVSDGRELGALLLSLVSTGQVSPQIAPTLAAPFDPKSDEKPNAPSVAESAKPDGIPSIRVDLQRLANQPQTFIDLTSAFGAISDRLPVGTNPLPARSAGPAVNSAPAATSPSPLAPSAAAVSVSTSIHSATGSNGPTVSTVLELIQKLALSDQKVGAGSSDALPQSSSHTASAPSPQEDASASSSALGVNSLRLPIIRLGNGNAPERPANSESRIVSAPVVGPIGVSGQNAPKNTSSGHSDPQNEGPPASDAQSGQTKHDVFPLAGMPASSSVAKQETAQPLPASQTHPVAAPVVLQNSITNGDHQVTSASISKDESLPSQSTHFGDIESVVSHFTSNAQLQASANRSEMRVALQTDKLGTVELHARVAGDQIGASIAVEKREAHAILAVELPLLQQALSEKQLRVDQVALFQGSLGSTAGDPHAHSQRRDHDAPLGWPGGSTPVRSQISAGTSPDTPDVLAFGQRLSVHA